MTTPIYLFGKFRLDPSEGALYFEDKLIPTPPKVLGVLRVLVEREGKCVSSCELKRQVWPDTHVGERSLAQSIFLLRKILVSDPSQSIDTLPRRGYRFHGHVQLADHSISHSSRSCTKVISKLHYPSPILIDISLLKIITYGNSPHDDSLIMGIMTAVASQLHRISSVQVRFNPSQQEHPTLSPDRNELQDNLSSGAARRYVLAFRLDRWEELTRIRVHLLKTPGDSLFWSNHFDCGLKQNPFTIEDSIATQISILLSDKILPMLTGQQKHLKVSRLLEMDDDRHVNTSSRIQ